MKLTGITLPGFKLDKNGKPVRSGKGKSVSQKIKDRKSKRVRVARGKRG